MEGMNRSSRLARGFAWMALAGVVSGCAALRTYQAQAPGVRVADIQVAKFSFTEQVLDVTLDVSNPNAYALAIAGIDYELLVDGQALADGATNDGFTLPASGSTQVRISVAGDLLDGMSRYQEWQKQGRKSVAYVLAGGLRVSGVPVSLPFSYSDEISLTPP